RSVMGSFPLLFAAGIVVAQDLAPRAYVITPSGSTAVVYSFSYTTGAISLDPTVPVVDAGSEFQTHIVSFYRALDLFGRSANITVALPYASGNFKATVLGDRQEVYRSGLGDGRLRIAANLYGAPAMSADEYRVWRERTT